MGADGHVRQTIGHLDRVCQVTERASLERDLVDESAKVVRYVVEPGERLPLLIGRDAHRVAQAGDLDWRHQAGVIVLVAGEREAPALDRVGDEASRPVVRDLIERVENRLDVVAAEIGHQIGQSGVVRSLEKCSDESVVARDLRQFRPPASPALEGQGRVEIVRAVVDPAAQGLATWLGEGGLKLRAVLDRHDFPADLVEEALDLGEQLLRHDAVQRLTVVVDDPPDVADVVLPALQECFEDVAFVEFGIADHRDHPAGRSIRGDEAALAEYVLRQGGEQGDCSAQTHRARRKVDGRHVLGT